MSLTPFAVDFNTPSANLLRDKVAIITGGSDGIGKVTAFDFAKEGAKVVIFGRTKEKVDRVVKELNSKYGSNTSIGYTGDVAKESDNKAVVDLTLKTYKKLDIAFNNAGIYISSGPVHETEEKVFDELFNVNVKGVIFGLKYQIPAILETAGGKGSIIVNSSAVSLRTWKSFSPNSSIYSATKSAIDTIVKTAVLEQGGKLRINTIHPAFVHTNILNGIMTKEQVDEGAKAIHLVPRAGLPEEISGIVTFLASDKASFISGSSYAIDGGALVI
jgi:NAD(P)-dependent dehydrogenase (short-subunit alcohol dehydrogenase family)